jgi:hypothetical protein
MIISRIPDIVTEEDNMDPKDLASIFSPENRTCFAFSGDQLLLRTDPEPSLPARRTCRSFPCPG